MLKLNNKCLEFMIIVSMVILVDFEDTSGSLASQRVGRIVVHSGKVIVKGPQGPRTIERSGDVFQAEIVQAQRDTQAFLIIGGVTRNLLPGQPLRMDDLAPTATQEGVFSRIGRLIERAFMPRSSRSMPLIHKGEDEKNGNRLRILYPKHTGILDSRPTFAWSESKGTYKVSVFLAEGDQERLWKKSIQNANSLPYPTDKYPLQPGQKYLWEVHDVRNDKMLDAGDFFIADKATRAKITDKVEKLRADCKRLSLPEDSRILAISGLYEQLGFRYEAIQVLLNARRRGIGEPTIAPALDRMLSTE